MKSAPAGGRRSTSCSWLPRCSYPSRCSCGGYSARRRLRSRKGLRGSTSPCRRAASNRSKAPSKRSWRRSGPRRCRPSGCSRSARSPSRCWTTARSSLRPGRTPCRRQMRPTAPCNGSSHKPMHPAPPSGKSSICGVEVEELSARLDASPPAASADPLELAERQYQLAQKYLGGGTPHIDTVPAERGRLCVLRPVPDRALTASTLGAAADSAQERNTGFPTAEGEKDPGA